uniref:Fucolectin tachylectin-4 pentraxin-1 domain-containing protein n=1 Tax=Haplochromis burtoni TaxID=8153 RepID=A0A3Q3CCS2_HAPBU
ILYFAYLLLFKVLMTSFSAVINRLFLVFFQGYPSSNLALKGEATQSSTLSFAAASKAIDGRRNSFYTNGFCSHTAEDETDPWWRVDLQHSFTITTVKVTNRGDCCAERLDGAEIRIGNSLENNGNNNPKCGTINSLGSSPTHTFQCNEMEGRYITVFLPGPQKILTMCEVEVFASLSAFPSPSQTTSGWDCAGTVLIM